MNEEKLTITIPAKDSFYSLYADGVYHSKHYEEQNGITELQYKNESAVFLYYTYPAHRRVYLIRNTTEKGERTLPGLSKPVKVIFRQFASRVDKTKRAVSYLNAHYKNAYGFSDIFYYELDVLLSLKGKLDYSSIDGLAKKWTK